MPSPKRKYTRLEIRSCAICGSEFILARLHGRTQQRYCGKDCAKEAKKRQQSKDGQALKMAQVKTTPRVCLRCGLEFQSWGISNRLCRQCRDENAGFQRNNRCDPGFWSV